MYIIRNLKIIAGVLVCCCLVPVVSGSATAADPVFGFGDSAAPWHIQADTIRKLDKTNYAASGGVVVSRGEKQVSADVIRFDGSTQTIVADGNVVMRVDKDVLSGDRMEMNLVTETGTIYGGELFLDKSHFYVSGDHIEKVGPESYKIDKFWITTCNPDDPDWHFSGRDLSFTVEGYGSMRHAAFWAKNVPLLYVPYLFFPVKTERQTGLLVPRLDYSRDNGGEYTQPFFWAVNDSTDMTLYAQYLSRRGVKPGIEYRQVFSERSKIVAMADGLRDRRRNTEPGDGHGYDGDDWLRPNADRYWVRMKADQSLPGGLIGRLDIDVVSDQDYLIEFDDGYMGFDATDAFFRDFFGRDLDEAEDTVRTNNLSLNRIWGRYSLNAALRWQDDVIKRRWQDEDTTLQRLPVVMFNAVRQPFFGTLLNYDLSGEYTFGFRRDGVKGHRTDIHPRLYLPLHWRNILFFEPSAGIRETAWWMDEPDASTPLSDRSPTRTMVDMKLDLSTELYRIFTANRKIGAAVRHTFLPRLVYEHVVSPDDDETYPVFNDELDRIREERLITYAIENIFTLRTGAGEQSSTVDEKRRYREICRLNIEQSYDIKEAREDDPAQWKNGSERRPFSPIRVALDLRPTPKMRIDVDAGWDKYEHGWSEFDIEVNLLDHRGDALYAAYRYDRDRAESIYAEGALALNRFLTLYAAHEHNFFDHIDIETSVGCLYNAGCWSLDVSFTDEPDDDKLSVMIKLHGLSDMNTGAAKRRFEMIGM